MTKQSDIGLRIKALREERGWNTSQLAAKAGLGQSAVSLIETGARPNPSSQTLLALARAFRVSIDELFGYDAEAEVDETATLTERVDRLEVGLRDLGQHVRDGFAALKQPQSSGQRKRPGSGKRS